MVLSRLPHLFCTFGEKVRQIRVRTRASETAQAENMTLFHICSREHWKVAEVVVRAAMCC